ncbi:contact-dependent growth inhibition system immunity protein [Achromobacter sp.]|uniref:contact-dependent growth inhibition system immunity protein n=1 Tax=Achromobacter sp. TaxID=134375 RepID=UPI003C78DC59
MTTTQEKYPELDQLFWAYFNEDFDLSGDTIEEIATSYRRAVDQRRILLACAEMNKFMSHHGTDAADAFAKRWGSFDPKLWGHTIASFFDELKRVLNS